MRRRGALAPRPLHQQHERYEGDEEDPQQLEDSHERCHRRLFLHQPEHRGVCARRCGGRIGARGLAHLLTHPRLRAVPFVLETPGMDEGYDATNLERCRALIAGVALDPLPPEAFRLSRRAAASGPAEDDVQA